MRLSPRIFVELMDEVPAAAPDAEFFNGRFMVEIEAWDWPIYVGISPDAIPPEYRFQGGLGYSRGIDITGRLRAPSRRGEN
jgi:hypothetical protein